MLLRNHRRGLVACSHTSQFRKSVSYLGMNILEAVKTYLESCSLNFMTPQIGLFPGASQGPGRENVPVNEVPTPYALEWETLDLITVKPPRRFEILV